MKHTKLSLLAVAAVALSSQANAALTTLELNVTNGSLTPISPAVVYLKVGSNSASPVGSVPTPGFIALCQKGDAAQRLTELSSDANIKSAVQTTAPISPGESQTIEIDVTGIDLRTHSLHLETMYGKTKDVCGVSSVSSHGLFALKQDVTKQIVQKDDVVITGAFLDPKLPAGMTYLDPSACPSATDAVSCLRELALPNAGPQKVRFFAGYLPSLVNALESKYGFDDVQSLIFPTSGAIQLNLRAKR